MGTPGSVQLENWPFKNHVAGKSRNYLSFDDFPSHRLMTGGKIPKNYNMAMLAASGSLKESPCAAVFETFLRSTWIFSCIPSPGFHRCGGQQCWGMVPPMFCWWNHDLYLPISSNSRKQLRNQNLTPLPMKDEGKTIFQSTFAWRIMIIVYPNVTLVKEHLYKL